MSSCTRAFVAFGANLGDPAAAFSLALQRLAELPGTRVVAHSSLYRSAPVGVEGQPDYINAVIELSTALAARPLLDALLSIEHEGGRTRDSRMAPRTMDLDLLLHGDAVIDEPGLQVPHPRMHLRAFALVPLAEIAPDAAIPGHGPAAALLPGVAGQAIARA
ncbi:2-amino-4-hydroxy-6-hydroxymethyldihydropteridine diphosphokinase [Thauera linaloolentis]|uniref:2-amino-4-hydroxy-6-hydroxymethyldihydropteridine pyrophosphokinase n=1 Tax=Thauera linaloolentis (strain DSM 12138 / JCM 21573 / CCUG 41526 / CIP 105981 / IAM 15112 / NBRC 102519 / 47Lol) TaxID=1123367 RepID=N6YX87_THAL4|nr:2-amino-4-hydroxy-6-hydroxymethyldihydropteridine diphosphokinase [Thauera linaloolentis]ENO86753.1 2-amino-4-hydroxy-6-hydroxymethyldihydropteridine diphosphokinase [Thauera linaloolentis 47Lol = DSM 12138]MCM8567054.1 2-amino-4-hydroxy-6-hydroxymethyldihydropteridine diphosphokinase [Thauera linaloolentis]